MNNSQKNGGVEPTVMVIFGATGDLAQTKLFPALFDLFQKGLLAKKFKLVAFGRREMDDIGYQAFIRDAILTRRADSAKEGLEGFLTSIRYVKGDFNELESYQNLAEALANTDREFNVCSNKLFYLAVPPSLYELILTKLSRSGLTIPCGNGQGWTRVLIEKPFGKDTETARRLDRLLGKLFKEIQIFRIDHYLAKETVQNILAFRFSNSLFEPIWNRKHIERIEIRAFEKSMVGERGALYDGLGALRDVGQNHLLAMLALITMNAPKTYTASAIQKERARVLRKLSLYDSAGVKKVVRAQYRGYQEEKGVRQQSDTETFFSMNVGIRVTRWKGVPIELTAGKAMDEDKTEITIHFRDVDCGPGDIICNRNVLRFRIQPKEGISILFWVKKPGVQVRDTHAQELSFNYADAPETRILPNAYEQVLYDCVRGDQTLFASTDEVEAAWRLITPILEKWGKNEIKSYTPGASLHEIIGEKKGGK